MEQEIYYVASYKDIKDKPASIQVLGDVFSRKETALKVATKSFEICKAELANDKLSDVIVTIEGNALHATLDDEFEVLFIAGSIVVDIPDGETLKDIIALVSFNKYDAFKDYAYTENITLRGYDIAVTDVFFYADDLNGNFELMLGNCKADDSIDSIEVKECLVAGNNYPSFHAIGDCSGYVYNTTIVNGGR